MLLCHREAEDEHDETGSSNDHHCPEPSARSVVASHEVGQRFPKEQRDERTAIGKEHTERREHGLLVGVVCHHSQHGTIRHIDARIDGHHEDIGDIGPDELTGIVKVGRSKQQDTANAEERGHP